MILPEQPPPNPFGRAVLNGPADFLPEWDVESIGKSATDRLLEAIEAARGSDRVDPDRKIQILLGPPGYGKTHLFGRIAHRLGNDVLFIFLPPIEDVRRPLVHIRHHVVMNVFEPRGDGPSPLENALARLCRPSILMMLSDLPRRLEAEYAPLRARLEADAGAVREVVGAVTTFPPFKALGESLARAFPDLDGNVVQAFALGWSPERDSARRWLRGEMLPEEQSRRLGLPEDPPAPVDVIKAVAALIAGPAPLVLGIDQLDVLLTDEKAPLQFSNAMMILRAAIPNLLLVLGCLEVDWKFMVADKFTQAFSARASEHKLDVLHEPEAFELVRRRLDHWPGGPAVRSGSWPIDEPSLQRLLARPQTPRGLIKTCEQAYDEWSEGGKIGQLVDLDPITDVPPDPVILFRREWDKELDSASGNKARSFEDVLDQRLARAFKEGLDLLLERAGGVQGGVCVREVREDPVRQVAGNPDPYRYSFEVVLEGREGPKSVIIALEVNHSPRPFSYYFTNAKEMLGAQVVGLSFVTAKPQLPAGPAVKAAMDQETRKGRFRTIPLADYADDFARLECYLTLLDRASTQVFQLAGRTITVGECRKLAAEAGVLAGMRLFDQAIGGWVYPAEAPDAEATEARAPAEEPHAAGPEPTAAPAPEPDEAVIEDRLEWAATCQETIVKRLGELGARVRTAGATQIGPTFARFLVTPYPATTINKVRNRAEDLKIGMGVEALPLVNSQAGAINIDVQLPERFRKTIRLADVGPEPTGMAAAFPVGQDVEGKTRWLDFADANTCHLLVAGTTGSGKSEFLKVLIAALARRLGPNRVKFGLVDPKQVTFNFGERTGPFLLRPVANTADDALGLVKACFEETERRYEDLKRRKLEDLGQWQAVDPKAPPRQILIFDEFADLMADKDTKKELEAPLKRLGAKARAAGVHLVLATQRPEATVVTPLLRSNLPARIGLKVASPADSKIILNKPDAADLLGRGDLLWERGAGLIRLQSPIVGREELEGVLFPR